jgi:hypothetical protein
LAELINFIGEGLPPYLWTNMAEPAERMGSRPEARDARKWAVSPTGTP